MKATNQQIADCFRKARRHLADSSDAPIHRRYICYRISTGSSPFFVKAQAKKIITDRLEGKQTLGDWLRSKGVCDPYQDRCRLLQAHRKAWLTLLIKEFRGKSNG